MIRSWYHSETACDYNNGFQTHKSVSYAQSTDGGRTWTKPNHPNNVVIRGSNDPCGFPCGHPLPCECDEGDVHQTGSGDPSVIRVGDYYYMYFTDTDQEFPNHYATWAEGLARSPIVSGGLPGTWQKWCDGGWSSQPDCHAQALYQLGSASWTVSRSTALGQLFGVFVNLDSQAATPGIQLLSSTDGDGMNWTLIPGATLIYSPPPPSPPPLPEASPEIYQYPALVPETGGSSWAQSAWLYYMYVYPHDDYVQDRYLVRRRVDVTVHDFDVATPQAAMPLQQSYSLTHQDHWVTTVPICISGLFDPCDASAPLGTTYDHDQTGLLLGAKVYSSGGSDLVALQDCYYDYMHDHYISLAADCEGGEWLRTLGYIWQTQRSGTVLLYRCFDAATWDHHVSADPSCEGATLEFALGYAPLAAGN